MEDNIVNNKISEKFECYSTTETHLLRPTKQAKLDHVSTITLGYLCARKGSTQAKDQKRIRILFDSGCGATLINHSFVKKLEKTKIKTTKWKTKAGSFKTEHKCKIKFTLPAFDVNKQITWTSYIEVSDPTKNRYDLIVGRDLMQEIGLDLLFSESTIKWGNMTIPMASSSSFDTDCIDDFEEEIMFAHDPLSTEAERIQSILDAKYTPADLNKISEECEELTTEQKQQLLDLMNKFKPLFDGSLGTWKTKPVDLELKDPNCKPHHSKPYPVPYSQEGNWGMKWKDCVQMVYSKR